MLTRRTLLATSAAAAASAAVIRPASAAISLDLSTAWPDGNVHTENSKIFAAKVAEATGGEVTINVHSGGGLGFKGPEHLRAVRDGLVPMADVLNTQQVGDAPLLAIENIPFLVSSEAELKVLHKHVRPEFDRIAADFNQKILYTAPWPGQSIFLKINTDSLDDFSRIKIRVADKNTQDMCNALGMSAVLMPWAEVAQALATGRVDGVATSVISGVDGKFWEFLETVYPTNHTWASQMLTINLDTWESLGRDNQEKIEALGKTVEPEFWATVIDSAETSRQTLADNGMEIVSIAAPMLAAMQERTESLSDTFIELVPEAKPIIAAYLGDVGRA